MAELTAAQKEAQAYAIKIAQLRFKISQAKAWFASTDYFPHKVVRGEWAESDPKFVAYKKEAKVQSAIIEDSEAEIEALKKARREKLAAGK
jgi:hypothetical protein